MRAVLCTEHGPPERLVVEDVPSPTPGPGQVVLSVKAAGVNFPDTLIIQGRYQFQPPLPFSPGAEAAGVVKEVGAGVVGVSPGDRMIAGGVFGAFAEEMLADAATLVPVPETMDLTTAGAFLMTYATSHYALRDRARLQPGETLLVLGAAGGVGLAAVECGKAIGARVIAAASSPEKLAVCREHGADEGIDYASEDLRERLKELAPRGIDVCYDPVGGEYSEVALRRMAWEGRFLVVGFAAGEIPRIPLNLTLLKSCQIVGVFWGAFARGNPKRNRELIDELFSWHAEGRIRPLVSATYPLERAADALNDMLHRRVRGKVVLLPDAPA